ncbi:MAG: flagellar basal body-associated FliL family protein [Rubrivivax sp.]
MATAAPAETTDAAPAPKKSRKKLVIVLVVALLVLGVAGGGFMVYSKKKAAAQAELEAEAEADGTTVKKAAKEPKRDPKFKPSFLTLDLFTVNLADQDFDRYLQVQMSLELSDEAASEKVKNYMPAVRNNILMVLSQKGSAELMLKDGKVKLADELLWAVARTVGVEVSNDDLLGPDGQAVRQKLLQKSPVIGVHFSNFIIQ